MKNLRKLALPFALLLLTALPAIAQGQPGATVTSETEKQTTASAELTLPEGTMVEVQLSADVHSNYVQEGHLIAFTVVQPIKINDIIVIEKGAHARGRIVKVRKAGRWGRAGEIYLEMQDAVAVDGARIPINLIHKEKAVGDSDHAPTIISAGAGVATVAILGPFGAIYGAYLLARGGLNKGSDAVIPAGMLFETKVTGDTKVKVTLTAPAKKQPEMATKK